MPGITKVSVLYLHLYIVSTLLLLTNSCSLSGDLCLWNSNGYVQTLDADGGDYLQAESSLATLLSPVFKHNLQLQPTCSLDVLYKSSNDTYISVYSRLSDSPEVSLLEIIPPTTSNEDIWNFYRVRIPEVNTSFNLQIEISYGLEENITPNSNFPLLQVKSLELASCLPATYGAISTHCLFHDDRLCQGWKIEKDEATQGFSFIMKDGHLMIDETLTKSGDFYKLTKLISPEIPVRNPPTGSCQVTVEYKLEDYSRGPLEVFMRINLRFLLMMIYKDKREVDHLRGQLPRDIALDAWQTYTIPLPDLGSNPAALRAKLVLYAYGDKSKPGRILFRNIAFDDSCLPQIPLYTKPPPPDSAFSSSILGDASKSIFVKDRATSYSFTACGAVGRLGPTSNMCIAHYADTVPFVNVSIDDNTLRGVQKWIVPKSATFNIMMYGASGGPGYGSKDTAAMIRGRQYTSAGIRDVELWPSMIHVKVDLQEGDVLYIVVGQAGGEACQRNAGSVCKGVNQTKFDDAAGSSGGGGGGGGGGSFVAMMKNDTLTVLAVAGGGGGMGKIDLTYGTNYTELIDEECITSDCENASSNERPGYGGSASQSVKSPLKQDGGFLSPFHSRSLYGGRGCESYSVKFDTPGGFGGGGGGCTAGGGGGGYTGGRVSLLDNPNYPGLQGKSYHNSDMVELVSFEQFDPYVFYSPNGWVEITEQSPPCPTCNFECRWLDANFTDYDCICKNGEVSAPDKKGCLPEKVPELAETTWQLDRENPITYIIGGLVVLVVIVGALFVVVFRKIKHSRRGNTLLPRQAVDMDANPLYQGFDNLPTIIPEESIKCIRCLGEGKFSKVFEARMALNDRWDSEEITVAVKKAVINNQQTRINFLQEAHTISSFDHTNIVKTLGVVMYADYSIGIVMDVLQGGDLRSFLRQNKLLLAQNDNDGQLELVDLLKIASEIASACKYLEEKKFIHRDIAARNILLTEKGKNRVAKISDFGLSRDINHGDYFCSPHGVVPIRWYPPESIRRTVHTPKSDVWSFGILLWEIFTLGEQPYPGIDNEHVANKIAEGYTMDPPSQCPVPVAELMMKCWAYEPESRPYFSHVYQQLNKMHQSAELSLCGLNMRPSITSSASSGFDETLDSPGSIISAPLLGGGHNSSLSYSDMIHEKDVTLEDLHLLV